MKLYSYVLGELGTNCYIWADEKTGSAMVIDAPDCAEEIVKAAESNGLKICEIVLTHGHFDHILALAELKRLTGAPVSVFEKTERFLSDRVLNLCHYVGAEYEPIKPDKIFKDGDIIDFCGNSIRVIHTPGHTEDSICLLCGNTLISGDTLFRRSVGRWDHPTGDMKQEMASIKNKLMTLPDDTLVYPGHGAPTTIGEERGENPYVE